MAAPTNSAASADRRQVVFISGAQTAAALPASVCVRSTPVIRPALARATHNPERSNSPRFASSSTPAINRSRNAAGIRRYKTSRAASRASTGHGITRGTKLAINVGPALGSIEIRRTGRVTIPTDRRSTPRRHNPRIPGTRPVAMARMRPFDRVSQEFTMPHRHSMSCAAARPGMGGGRFSRTRRTRSRVANTVSVSTKHD